MTRSSSSTSSAEFEDFTCTNSSGSSEESRYTRNESRKSNISYISIESNNNAKITKRSDEESPTQDQSGRSGLSNRTQESKGSKSCTERTAKGKLGSPRTPGRRSAGSTRNSPLVRIEAKRAECPRTPARRSRAKSSHSPSAVSETPDKLSRSSTPMKKRPDSPRTPMRCSRAISRQPSLTPENLSTSSPVKKRPDSPRTPMRRSRAISRQPSLTPENLSTSSPVKKRPDSPRTPMRRSRAISRQPSLTPENLSRTSTPVKKRPESPRTPTRRSRAISSHAFSTPKNLSRTSTSVKKRPESPRTPTRRTRAVSSHAISPPENISRTSSPVKKRPESSRALPTRSSRAVSRNSSSAKLETPERLSRVNTGNAPRAKTASSNTPDRKSRASTRMSTPAETERNQNKRSESPRTPRKRSRAISRNSSSTKLEESERGCRGNTKKSTPTRTEKVAEKRPESSKAPKSLSRANSRNTSPAKTETPESSSRTTTRNHTPAFPTKDISMSNEVTSNKLSERKSVDPCCPTCKGKPPPLLDLLAELLAQKSDGEKSCITFTVTSQKDAGSLSTKQTQTSDTLSNVKDQHEPRRPVRVKPSMVSTTTAAKVADKNRVENKSQGMTPTKAAKSVTDRFKGSISKSSTRNAATNETPKKRESPNEKRNIATTQKLNGKQAEGSRLQKSGNGNTAAKRKSITAVAVTTSGAENKNQSQMSTPKSGMQNGKSDTKSSESTPAAKSSKSEQDAPNKDKDRKSPRFPIYKLNAVDVDKYCSLLAKVKENEKKLEECQKKIDDQEIEMDEAYEAAVDETTKIAEATSDVIEARKIHKNFKDEATRIRVHHQTNMIEADIFETDSICLQEQITELQQEIDEMKAINRLTPEKLKEKTREILIRYNNQREGNEMLEEQIENLRNRLNEFNCMDNRAGDEPKTPDSFEEKSPEYEQNENKELVDDNNDENTEYGIPPIEQQEQNEEMDDNTENDIRTSEQNEYNDGLDEDTVSDNGPDDQPEQNEETDQENEESDITPSEDNREIVPTDVKKKPVGYSKSVDVVSEIQRGPRETKSDHTYKNVFKTITNAAKRLLLRGKEISQRSEQKERIPFATKPLLHKRKTDDELHYSQDNLKKPCQSPCVSNGRESKLHSKYVSRLPLPIQTRQDKILPSVNVGDGLTSPQPDEQKKTALLRHIPRPPAYPRPANKNNPVSRRNILQSTTVVQSEENDGSMSSNWIPHPPVYPDIRDNSIPANRIPQPPAYPRPNERDSPMAASHTPFPPACRNLGDPTRVSHRSHFPTGKTQDGRGSPMPIKYSPHSPIGSHRDLRTKSPNCISSQGSLKSSNRIPHPPTKPRPRVRDSLETANRIPYPSCSNPDDSDSPMTAGRIPHPQCPRPYDSPMPGSLIPQPSPSSRSEDKDSPAPTNPVPWQPKYRRRPPPPKPEKRESVITVNGITLRYI